MIHHTAMVSESAVLGPNSKVWANSTIREGAHIGNDTSLGIGVYVGPFVHVGSNCKIQNGAYLYEPCSIGDGVFVGPRVVFTNDKNPRAIKSNGKPILSSDWTPEGVTVNRGASIGAMVVCVAPVNIGSWSMIAAGSVVLEDVPSFALMAGIPAKRIGWVGRLGKKLIKNDQGWVCPDSGEIFIEDELGGLIDLSGESTLSNSDD